MKKKIMAVVLALALIFSVFDGYSVSAATSLKKDVMETVLLTVKEKLEIGTDYDQFRYSFNEGSASNARWYFNWTRTEDGAYISAEADKEGRIYNYNLKSVADSKVEVPNYTKQETVPFVMAFVDRVLPELSGKLELAASSYASYSNRYYLTFIRVENGIPMPDNSVYFQVDCMDAGVKGFSANWEYGVKVAAPDVKLSEDEAVAKLAGKLNMPLEYRIGYDDEGNEKIFLAYSSDRYYLAVNATTGKLYTSKSYSNDEWNAETGEVAFADDAVNDAGGSKAAELTEAEIGKLEELEGIISSDEAAELILNNPYLYFEKDVTYASSAYLNTYDDRYVWELALTDERPYDYDSKDWFRSYIGASVDAVTGEILSYNANVRDMYDYPDDEIPELKANYSKKACRKFFEDFVKSQAADRLAETKLTDTSRTYIAGYDYINEKYSYFGYDFSYNRYYENIPFTANYIMGAVEGITGKVTSYYTNWTENAQFPSSKNVIGAEKAAENFVKSADFGLNYELVNVYNDDYTKKTTKSRLVYNIRGNELVDALTGEIVDYSGNPYRRQVSEYSYTDIAGTKYERTITLLADMGIGFEGSEFKPSAVITDKEFEELLNGRLSVYYYGGTEKKESKAVEMTREMFAEKIVEELGMTGLSKLDIFKTGYDDEADISSVGAVAIVKGYGLMGAAKGNRFKPAQKVTRGEAADIIMKCLTTDADAYRY